MCRCCSRRSARWACTRHSSARSVRHPAQFRPDEVLGGTGLVEAGTYIILVGTLLGGVLLRRPTAASMRNGPPYGGAGGCLIGAYRASSCPRPAGARRATVPFRRHIIRASRTWSTLAHPAPVPALSRSASSGRWARSCCQFRRWSKCVARSDRRDPVPRHLLGRRRGQIRRGQPPAPR